MALNLKEIFNDREACEKAATDAQLDPRDRAACADRADELGHGVADLHHFVQMTEVGREPFFIGRYLVTQTQYARFLNAEAFASAALWRGLPKFSELDRKGQSKRLGDWGVEEDREGAADARMAFDPDLAAVQQGQLPHDREPQAASQDAGRLLVVDPHELAE